MPSLINLDFADVRTVMQSRGLAHMGIGIGKGENRMVEAAKQAISSPMLETSIDGARAVLINITGGPDTSIIDINEAAQLITAAADPEANIIFGAGIDESMDDEVKITVIATGFEKPSFTENLKPSIGENRDDSGEEPARSPRPSRYEEEQVSPIFERRARNERPLRESADTGYEQREQRRAERQQTRRPRVYQDDGQEQRNQSRRGFAPDVPSFMKKK